MKGKASRLDILNQSMTTSKTIVLDTRKIAIVAKAVRVVRDASGKILGLVYKFSVNSSVAETKPDRGVAKMNDNHRPS